VRWIENVLKAFQDGNAGQFTLKAWDNLDNVRCENQQAGRKSY
jgi:hypothetical protein